MKQNFKFEEEKISEQEDWLYNLWGLMQNENAGPFAQKLRIS
jgi:hypothetical protein